MAIADQQAGARRLKPSSLEGAEKSEFRRSSRYPPEVRLLNFQRGFILPHFGLKGIRLGESGSFREGREPQAPFASHAADVPLRRHRQAA